MRVKQRHATRTVRINSTSDSHALGHECALLRPRAWSAQTQYHGPHAAQFAAQDDLMTMALSLKNFHGLG